MKNLGCKLVPVTRGTRTLKDAVDSAFEEYLKDPVNYIYAIGSVVGPHPFPKMVRDFQSIVGRESLSNIIRQCLTSLRRVLHGIEHIGEPGKIMNG